MGGRRVLAALGMLLVGVCAASPTYDERDLIAIARAAVNGQPLKTGSRTPPEAVFVTVEIDGKVVGCRGSLVPRSRFLEDEVADAARAAAAHDPRYGPIPKNRAFKVTVTIVQRLEPLDDVRALTPDEGLVLRCNAKLGVVLPWEGKDPATRLQWAYRKAGVAFGTIARLERMVAVRFRG